MSDVKILQVGEGRTFAILDVPTPTPGPGEALLRIDAVTTCPQWDLHLRHNEPMYPGHRFTYPYTPGQPGHEATGTVEAVGQGVTALAVGDRVSAWRDTGHHRPGCYAQYVVHRVENLIRVPSHLPPEATAPVELAMCVGASFLMLREMNAIAGRRFAVVGLGPAGLIAAQMARAEGAAEVIGFDFVEARRRQGLAIGLDAAFDSREETLPLRFDTGIDCVGARASVEWLMDRTVDTVALFGVQREPYTFAPRHYRLRLCGYPGHSRAAAEYAVSLIVNAQLDLLPLVTHRFPLEGYAEAIDLLERQEAIKVCFFPWR
ncbi:MAG: alcohol dehydrogenase catalytic domain-containing protein [Capsulimonadales bacterium]|nr:alcohol dehydrogenase catalytic domain-containing protein [Capsulimonadales bacterium]